MLCSDGIRRLNSAELLWPGMPLPPVIKESLEEKLVSTDFGSPPHAEVETYRDNITFIGDFALLWIHPFQWRLQSLIELYVAGVQQH